MKAELLKLHKRIYQNFKSSAFKIEGPLSSELTKYRNSLSRFSKRDFEKADLENLQLSCAANDLIYIADFHTFDQNIRTVLRILRYLKETQASFVLALEMIHHQHQGVLDAYREGHLTELEFLDAIHYHDTWRFPWSHYKLLFDFCAETQIPIKAINSQGSLSERDEYAAKLLKNIVSEYPDDKVIIMFGELHLAPNKLPRRAQKYLPDKSYTLIHQNLDEVYWKMAKTNQHHPVIKFTSHEFCLNAAPPWVKYESMVYWYEGLGDDPEFDIHEYIIQKGRKLLGEDSKDHFIHLLEQIGPLIKTTIGSKDLTDFNLNDHRNLEYIQEQVTKLPRKDLMHYYQTLILEGHSFRTVNTNILFCSSYSLNRLSYLMGIHLFGKLISKGQTSDLSYFITRKKEKTLSLLILEHCFGHFFSKIINPYRKCDMYADIKGNAQRNPSNIHFKMALDFLDGKMRAQDLNKIKLTSLHRVSMLIGHILAEYLTQQSSQKAFLNLLDCLPPSWESIQHLRDELLSSQEYTQHYKRPF